MKRSLRFQLSLGNTLIVLLTVCAISLSARFFIKQQFDRYIISQQSAHAASLASTISAQYGGIHMSWNEDYIHGFGMYALHEGYIIRVTDLDGCIIWDAEHHDMELCHGVMQDIMERIHTSRPETSVQLIHDHLPLTDADGEIIGYADIQYYAPNSSHTEDFAFLNALNRILLLTGAVSLLMAILIGFWMAGRIARPIAAVTGAARDVSGGNYDLALPDHGQSTELDTLTRSIRHMAESLKTQEERKRRMTTDIAHELRTPIANISSYLEAMAEGVWEPTSERLQECHREAQRIAGIVGQLETLHRSEEPQAPLELSSVSVGDLCHSVAASFARAFEEHHQTCRVEGEDFALETDAGKLRQVLMNLLSNAMKYTPDGKDISVSFAHTEKNARIRVEDQGIGIPKEEQDLIFERFYRTDLSRSRDSGGAGIGLAITKALVEQLGGEIHVESEEHRGSTFTVTLPMKKS
ncbi:MAG: HAMP domain-containing histidine kinase [Clostridia bacterium]|nr:HAMP domain-containing histidine kinase [Clostridia bacterium]